MKAIRSILLSTFAIALPAIASEAAPPSPAATDSIQSSIPQSLESMLKGYKNDWSQLTGYEFSGLHWNQFIVIYAKLGESIYKHNYKEFIKHYLNDDFDEDSGPDFKKYPIGSLFLKEHFNAKDDKREEGTILTLMEKLPEGYDDEYGNWKYIWVNSQSGAIIAEGNSSNELLYSSCIECHSNMSDRDYVFATYMQPDSELATTP